MTRTSKISHPGYGKPEIRDRDYYFIFSSDLSDWMQQRARKWSRDYHERCRKKGKKRRKTDTKDC